MTAEPPVETATSTADAIAPPTDRRVPPVEVIDLKSEYGEHLIHDGVNLSVKRGEVLGVVGGSGAGKSVLLNTIIGLRDPDGGEIRIFGRNIARASNRQMDAIERRWGGAVPARRAVF